MTDTSHNLPSESTRHISTLHEWDKNPRSITKEGFDRLKRQLKTNKDRYGKYLFKPLLINEDGVVLGGNMRLKALKELGVEDIDVSIVPTRNEQEMVDIALKDNDSAGKTEKDELLALIEDLPDLKLDDYAVHFDVPETLTDFMEQFKEVEEDEVPEVSQEPAKSELGKVYKLGRHFLMCGDATKIEDVEKLMNGQKADMVFTDPPYGMDFDPIMSTRQTEKDGWLSHPKQYSKVIGDDKDYDPTHLFTMFPDIKEMFLWGADYYSDRLQDKNKGSWIVWDKRKGIEDMQWTTSEFELCWSKNKHQRQIARITWSGILGTEQEHDHATGRVHPTQKPVLLADWFIKKYSKDGWKIIDLFGGSGSTLIACEQTNRTCFMMELDEKYVDVVRRRWVKFTTGSEDGWVEKTPVGSLILSED